MILKTLAGISAAAGIIIAPATGCDFEQHGTGLHITPHFSVPRHPSEQVAKVLGEVVIYVRTPPQEGHVHMILQHRDPVTHVWITDGSDSAAGPWYAHTTRNLQARGACSRVHRTMKWRMRITWRGIATDGTRYGEQSRYWPNRYGKRITCG